MSLMVNVNLGYYDDHYLSLNVFNFRKIYDFLIHKVFLPIYLVYLTQNLT